MIKEEAIEILYDIREQYNIFSDDEEEQTRYYVLSLAIQALSEQPFRKTGKWIIEIDGRGRHAECPYCGEWKYNLNQKFCGKCGVLMKGEEDD